MPILASTLAREGTQGANTTRHPGRRGGRLQSRARGRGIDFCLSAIFVLFVTTRTPGGLDARAFNMCGDVATPNLYAVAQQYCHQAPDTRTTVMGRRSGSSSSNDDVERAGPRRLRVGRRRPPGQHGSHQRSLPHSPLACQPHRRQHWQPRQRRLGWRGVLSIAARCAGRLVTCMTNGTPPTP